MYFKGFFYFFWAMVLLTACHSPEKDQNDQDSGRQEGIEEALIEANKSAVKAEKEMIYNYAKRHKWPLTKAKGVYYVVYEEGEGETIQPGDEVVFQYSLMLINGAEITSQGETGTLKVGEGGAVVSGLHRAMQLLRKGDRAKVIVPSHLAFGLAGDEDKIPSKATLIYDIRVMDIRRTRN